MKQPLIERTFFLSTPYHAIAIGSVVTLDEDDYIVHRIKRIVLLDEPEPMMRIEATVRRRTQGGEPS